MTKNVYRPPRMPSPVYYRIPGQEARSMLFQFTGWFMLSNAKNSPASFPFLAVPCLCKRACSARTNSSRRAIWTDILMGSSRLPEIAEAFNNLSFPCTNGQPAESSQLGATHQKVCHMQCKEDDRDAEHRCPRRHFAEEQVTSGSCENQGEIAERGQEVGRCQLIGPQVAVLPKLSQNADCKQYRPVGDGHRLPVERGRDCRDDAEA